MAPHADAAANGSVNGSATQSNLFKVESPDVVYTDNEINTKYVYRTTSVTRTDDGKYVASPKETVYNFKVDRKVGKVGMMLVGWGGNNGTTVTAGIMANRRGLVWDTREGKRAANYYGSLVMGSTVKLGTDPETAEEVNIPFRDMLPMVHPNDLVVGGWDISGMNLGDAMDRAAVLEPSLKEMVRKDMAALKPLPSIYYPDFIAANQEDRADNVLPGSKACWDHVEQLRKDIREFKSANGLDKVIVLWTANTERYADIVAGVNDTADNLVKAIKEGHEEVSPSTVFAVASILENSPFINGSPQNTFVPGAIQFAEQHGAFIGGDDFKSGQTKMKSALVDFLINAGIKLTSIASYTTLATRWKDLSSPQTFRSRKFQSTCDDMSLHTELSMSTTPKSSLAFLQTISMFNVCEDSLLASPLILDLGLLAEVMTRVSWKVADGGDKFKGFHSVLSVLSYMLKGQCDIAPMTPPGTPVVNALAKQRAAVTNIFRACVGLQPESDMTLEHKLF
ncbi:inositol-3-phosphate synthase [Coccidioides immitis RMSCC 3703]|uniref:inositol-3-phosphate synthase n=1 Tax=Coccidioides immitis RMSCC 3703 TaxID=454286 RepID=A0A0J8QTH8_COCIT|nr:inositol-3-phosphate synthase [Coccidioides immitis RMSCC 3703]